MIGGRGEIIPHILCGGSGTRLWPMSREAFPKQFVPLIDGKSLLQCALERAAALSPRAVCLTAVEHRFLVEDIGRRAGTEVTQILEPVARNTAAAMACAALLAEADDLLLFLPADHYIPDAEGFAATVRRGLEAALRGYIVTFGVVPGYPTPPTATSSVEHPSSRPSATQSPVSSKSRTSRKPSGCCSREATSGMLGFFWSVLAD